MSWSNERRALVGMGLLAAACPSVVRAADAPQADPAARGHARTIATRSITSKDGLEYRLILSIPAGAPPAGGYPVIYVTDGNGHAPVVGEIARLNENWLGPVLVVGIGYPTEAIYDAERRSYDLTPPGELVHPDLETADFVGMKLGGADRFLAFIERELKPSIEAEFRIDRSRQALFGHSLGGLFVVYALFTGPGAFTAYVAASPSIWWNRRAVLKIEPAFAAKAAAHKDLRVLVTVGENEGRMSPFNAWKLRRLAVADPASLGGGTPDQILARMRRGSADADMIGNARALARRLKSYGLDAVFVEYPGEEHTPELVDGYNRGVRFAFGPGY